MGAKEYTLLATYFTHMARPSLLLWRCSGSGAYRGGHIELSGAEVGAYVSISNSAPIDFFTLHQSSSSLSTARLFVRLSIPQEAKRGVGNSVDKLFPSTSSISAQLQELLGIGWVGARQAYPQWRFASPPPPPSTIPSHTSTHNLTLIPRTAPPKGPTAVHLCSPVLMFLLVTSTHHTLAHPHMPPRTLSARTDDGSRLACCITTWVAADIRISARAISVRWSGCRQVVPLLFQETVYHSHTISSTHTIPCHPTVLLYAGQPDGGAGIVSLMIEWNLRLLPPPFLCLPNVSLLAVLGSMGEGGSWWENESGGDGRRIYIHRCTFLRIQ